MQSVKTFLEDKQVILGESSVKREIKSVMVALGNKEDTVERKLESYFTETFHMTLI